MLSNEWIRVIVLALRHPRRRDFLSGNAIAALAELGDPRGIVVLRELLREAVESRSTWLESAARSALKKLGADR